MEISITLKETNFYLNLPCRMHLLSAKVFIAESNQ